MYATLDNTQYEWSDVEKKVASLGLKFVPTVKRHNSARKYTDFLEFCRKLKLALFFYDLNQQSTTEDQPTSGTMNTSEEMDNKIEYSKPWAKPSNFKPTPGKLKH